VSNLLLVYKHFDVKSILSFKTSKSLWLKPCFWFFNFFPRFALAPTYNAKDGHIFDVIAYEFSEAPESAAGALRIFSQDCFVEVRLLQFSAHNLFSFFSAFHFQSLINFKISVNIIFGCFMESCDASVIKQHCKIRKGCRNKPVFIWKCFLLAIFLAKKAVESHCPRVVTCADVLAIVTRDCYNGKS
jgi:peroxidase